MDTYDPTPSDRWLTPKEAAEYLAISERTVRRRAADLGGVKLGPSERAPLRFKRSALDRWANRFRLRSGE